MAIAFDATADGGLVNPGTSLTWSHTCTGSNRLLIVGLFGDNASTDATGAKITGVTYNGVAMTQLLKVAVVGDRWIYLYALLAPAAGAHSVVASASSSIAIGGVSASYTGVSQSGLPDASITGTGATLTNVTYTTTLTTVSDNCWPILLAKCLGAAPAAAAATTLRISSTIDLGIFDANAVVHPAGSVSLNVKNTVTSTNWASCMISVAPASGTNIAIALADTLTFLDTQAIAAALDRTSALTLAEAQTTDTGLTRTTPLTLAEAQQATAGAAPADTLTPVETTVTSGGQTNADTATLAESSTQAGGATSSDPLTPSEATATSGAYTASDSAALVEALLSAGGAALTDLATLVEASLHGGALSQSDGLTAADLLTWGTITTILLSLADALAVADSGSTSGGTALADPLAVAESSATAGAASLADALNPAETLATDGAIAQADLAAIAEQLGAWVRDGRLAIPADALTTLDSLGTLAGSLALMDSLSPSDRLLFLVIQKIIHQLSGTLAVRQRMSGTLAVTQQIGGTYTDG